MFAALVTAALVSPAEPPQENEKELARATKKELAALAGKWKVVKLTGSAGEENLAESTRPDMFFVFKGSELTMESDKKREVVKIGASDPTTDPKCIDLIETRRDKTERTIECVYKIDKDTLQIAICVPTEGKQRPTGFDKPTDARTGIWTLQRVKE